MQSPARTANPVQPYRKKSFSSHSDEIARQRIGAKLYKFPSASQPFKQSSHLH